jgi:hypothetical protein
MFWIDILFEVLVTLFTGLVQIPLALITERFLGA